MSNNCTPQERATCPPPDIPEPTPPCPSWDLCLPFGGRLEYRDGCIYLHEGTPPEDGTYGKIVIKGGCIINVLPEDIPLYNSSPCSPIPSPCNEEESTDLGNIKPSQAAGNLFVLDPAGNALVKLSVKAGSGINVTGDGTAANPLTISSSGDSASGSMIYIRPGNNSINITGNGTEHNPYIIKHKEQEEEYIIQGMSFDRYGHLQGYTEPTESTNIKNIKAGEGIKTSVDVNSGTVTVGLEDPLPNFTGDYFLGGYIVNLNKNRIKNISRYIQTQAGEYKIDNYKITIDEYGSIIEISPIENDSINTAASKIFKGNNDPMNRSVSFSINEDASFRISYQSTKNLPQDISVMIDGNYYDAMISTNRVDLLTNARFAPGSHTVSINTNIDDALAGDAIMDIFLTTVV